MIKRYFGLHGSDAMTDKIAKILCKLCGRCDWIDWGYAKTDCNALKEAKERLESLGYVQPKFSKDLGRVE